MDHPSIAKSKIVRGILFLRAGHLATSSLSGAGLNYLWEDVVHVASVMVASERYHYLINLAHIVSTQKDFALPAVVVVELWQAFFI